jgi:pSer/pThr/pTyr-binding forkhead associated (FHA) protein/type II secretory pathway predicted ATPase ExeA
LGETHKLVSPARVFARPTADEIWLGPAQQAALSQLSRPAAIRLLVGPPSSGKTTLLNHSGAHLATNTVVLACRGPKDDAAAVLAALLLSADLAPWDLSEIEQRNLLTVFIQQRRSQNRRVLLLIDDAHNFKPAAVEEIERILAFRIEKKSALEAVVAGPASITSQWNDVRRRLGLELSIHELPAPPQEALVGYLDWRLSRFEMQRFMTPVALQMIARLCGGRYAAADVLCQMSLLLLRQLSLDRADARVVRQAVATLAARQAAKLEPDRPSESEQQLDAPPQGYLLVSRGGKTMTRIPLGQRTLVGRSEHNDVCLPSPYLSRHHAVIVGTPEGYYLVDLNSINGVLLNGRRIERTVLCDEDVLTMGPFRLKVQVPDGLAQDTPFPEAETVADTAVMPSQAQGNSALWRVK